MIRASAGHVIFFILKLNANVYQTYGMRETIGKFSENPEKVRQNETISIRL